MSLSSPVSLYTELLLFSTLHLGSHIHLHSFFFSLSKLHWLSILTPPPQYLIIQMSTEIILPLEIFFFFRNWVVTSSQEVLKISFSSPIFLWTSHNSEFPVSAKVQISFLPCFLKSSLFWKTDICDWWYSSISPIHCSAVQVWVLPFSNLMIFLDFMLLSSPCVFCLFWNLIIF